MALRELEAVITAVVELGDPIVLAKRLSTSAADLATHCLASGQQLLRLGQLLRTLS